MSDKPNVVFVFGDQWRQQATGYAGDPNVETPNIDALAAESISFTNAIAGCPVGSPYRASLLSGQRPLTHGVFVNDVSLNPETTSIADAFGADGYDTAYIGKWHVDGHGRSNYIPPERHQGFDYWKVLECTHAYNDSAYYAGDADTQLKWDGYDAIAQTRDAIAYIREHDPNQPFFMMLSWGPPHAPYQTAPAEYRERYDADAIELRPNVPDACAEQAREDLAGYYAHCTALDDCIGDVLVTLREQGLEDNTIFVFTSDHGDMIGSQGEQKKQRPWDESIRVPFLLRYPALPGWQPRESDAPIDAPDIMPTLLALCGIPVPDTVEGLSFADHIAGGPDPSDGATFLLCPHPFGQWCKEPHGGREYRGLRTGQYTYTRDLNGPWLLYDNVADPYQMNNRVDDPALASVRDELDRWLQRKLDEQGDAFLSGMDYVRKWGYRVSENGTVPYTG